MDRFRVRNQQQRQWLDEAAAALHEADKLVQAAMASGELDAIVDLRARIGRLRGAIARAQAGVETFDDGRSGPIWTNPSPWCGEAAAR